MFKPKATGTLPVSKANLAFLRDGVLPGHEQALRHGLQPLPGFPLDQIPVAAKTGTGQAAEQPAVDVVVRHLRAREQARSTPSS